MINSVRNAVKVINCFNGNYEVGISDLAIQLEMNKSTVHHIVKSLYAEGVLVRTQNRKYRLGSQLLGWGNQVQEQYRSYFNVLPYLDALVKTINETAHLAILENEQVSYLAKVEPKKPVKIKTKIGDRQPLHCTALGKVLLAFQPKHMIEPIIKKPLIQRTAHTITNRESLFEELVQIKTSGYAIDDEEFDYGLYCIAAPVFDFMGNIICAISISGPEVRMRDKTTEIRQLLLTTTRKISNQVDF